jgi:hypothetical protein
MSNIEYLLISALIGFGVYTTYLINSKQRLENELDLLNEMIIAMARELKALGSPNVVIEECNED